MPAFAGGDNFTPVRRDARYCSAACKQASYRRRQHTLELAEYVWTLRVAGEIDGFEALVLLISPPAEALDRLGTA